MHPILLKICPRCRSEYRLEASICSDCGSALLELQPFPESDALPPAAELVCIRRGGPGFLRGVARALQGAGLSCRIDTWPPGEPIRGARLPFRLRGGHDPYELGLYVREEDADEARQLEVEHLARILPDVPSPPPLDVTSAECPACGAGLFGSGERCVSCGLAFPCELHVCPECRAQVEPEAARCSACGIRYG